MIKLLLLRYTHGTYYHLYVNANSGWFFKLLLFFFYTKAFLFMSTQSSSRISSHSLLLTSSKRTHKNPYKNVRRAAHILLKVFVFQREAAFIIWQSVRLQLGWTWSIRFLSGVTSKPQLLRTTETTLRRYLL